MARMTSWNIQQISTGDQNHPPLLNAAILYEDLSTGLRANVLFERIIRQLNLPTHSEVELLRTDLLTDAGVKAAASHAAAESGLVIFSLHGQDGLSAHVENWIMDWLRRNPGVPRAIVLLLDGLEDEAPESNPILARLQRLALDNSVECFYHFFNGDAAREKIATPPPVRPMNIPSPKTTAQVETHMGRFWGINE
jgi:hypothetical protein